MRVNDRKGVLVCVRESESVAEMKVICLTSSERQENKQSQHIQNKIIKINSNQSEIISKDFILQSYPYL